MTKKIRRQPSLEKAIDEAIWLNFKHRIKNKTFGVIQSIEGNYIITDVNHPTFIDEVFETLPLNYADMTYNHIKHISQDINPLSHFSEIKGMLSVMHGEILRYILSHRIPIEKFIRYELASRGHDEDHKWIGFERAEEIWLK
ncbi:hypothetical protein [uncultured Winogradskyella sp.]|uniref:hypothetical protein n=1 Tax=uncultured Winogradskyella sp. TaxID=395353 RepID=UPI002627D6B3|nr:hypothetical protein [uncultured Winogradskyella sp.]